MTLLKVVISIVAVHTISTKRNFNLACIGLKFIKKES